MRIRILFKRRCYRRTNKWYTGIGLAFVCAAEDIVLILTNDTMSQERRIFLKLRAELVLPQALKGWMVPSRRQKNLQLLFQTPLYHSNFLTPNPEVHRKTTAEEIWADTQMVDTFVAGVGTGGTVTGVG